MESRISNDTLFIDILVLAALFWFILVYMDIL